MSAASLVSLLVLIVAAPGLHRPAGALHGQGLRRREAAPGDRVFLPVERLIYRTAARRPEAGAALERLRASRCWPSASSRCWRSTCFQRVQTWLPLNPTACPTSIPKVAFNTAVSFVTNTNWQSYSGESTMGHLTQMAGLAVQNFVSAAVGMAVVVALIRGLARRRAARSATSGSTSPARRSASCCRSRSSSRSCSSARASIQNFTTHHGKPSTDGQVRPPTQRRAVDHRSPSRIPGGRSPARRPSRSSAPTAAASSTPTRPTRSRTRPGSRTCSRSSPSWSSRSRSRSPTGEMVGQQAPGPGRARRHVASLWLSTSLMAGFVEQGGNAELDPPGRRPVAHGRPGAAATWRARRSASAPASSGCSRHRRPARRPARSTRGHDSFTPLGGHDPARQHDARRGLARAASASASSAC